MTQTPITPNPPGDPAAAQWKDRPFDTLRHKWGEVPGGLLTRRKTADLLRMPDRELLEMWEQSRHESCTGDDGFTTRGWYHQIYKDVLRGKKVMDVGSGMGMDGITFAQHGAEMTFVDIVQSNLDLLKRLCSLMGVTGARFHYMQDTDSLKTLSADYDVIWCQGSLINAPYEIVRGEIQELVKHLTIGGRWIELAYPKERWQRDGSPPLEQWGRVTDGPGTPYMDWYDLDKLRAALSPAELDVVLSFNFHNDDFNWFDLVRRT